MSKPYFSYPNFLKLCLIFTLSVTVVLPVFCQKPSGNRLIDSVRKYRTFSPDQAIPMAKRSLAQSSDQSHKAENMLLVGVLFYDVSQYDSSLRYLDRALSAYQSLGDSIGIANAHHNRGVALEYQSRYDEALDNYQKGYEIRKKLGLKGETASSLNNIGNIQVFFNNYSKALELYVEALKLAEELNDKKAMANAYNNIGMVYDYNGDLDKALDYYDRARAGFEILGETAGLAGSLNNIGLIYKNKQHPEKAIPYYQQALKSYTALKSNYGVAALLNNIGMAYDLMNNETLALQYHQQALAMNQKIGNTDGIGNSLTNIGNSYLKLKQFERAKGFFLESLDIAKKNKANDRMVESYEGLARSYEGLGDFRQSLAFVKQMNIIRDTILSAEKSKKLYETEQKYESALKEKQIALLNSETIRQQLEIDQQAVLINQRNLQLLFILLTAGLTGAVLYLLYSRFRLQQAARVEAIKNEKEQAIVKSIYEQRMSISKDMHDEIGSGLTHISLLSELLSTQTNSEKEIRAEVQTISVTSRKLIQSMSEIIWAINPQNETLENLVFYLREQTNTYFESLNISYSIDLPDDVPSVKLTNLQRRNIFLVTKESINNAMKHSQATSIALSMIVRDDSLIFSVSDNGKGFEKGSIRRASNGLKNMQSRMEEIGGTFEISTDPGTGTKVLYSMPLPG